VALTITVVVSTAGACAACCPEPTITGLVITERTTAVVVDTTAGVSPAALVTTATEVGTELDCTPPFIWLLEVGAAAFGDAVATVIKTAAEDVGAEPNGVSETGDAGTTELITDGADPAELPAGGAAEFIAEGTTDTTSGDGGIVPFWGTAGTFGPAGAPGMLGAAILPMFALIEYPKASGYIY
jgi:hypothetical protein